MTSPFAHLDISEAFRNYMEGAIDRREYLSRRYAEDTDAITHSLNTRHGADGGNHGSGALADELDVADAQAEALGRFPSVPVIGDDRRVGASGGDDLREKNDG